MTYLRMQTGRENSTPEQKRTDRRTYRRNSQTVLKSKGSSFPIEAQPMDEKKDRKSNRERPGTGTADGYFKGILDSLPHIIFETDTDGNLLYLNQKGIECLGYSDEQEYLGKSLYTHVREKKEKSIKDINKALRKEQTAHMTVEITGKEGTRFPASLIATPVIEEDTVTRIRGVIQDITLMTASQKERERLILNLQKALENIKTLKGLLPICAHCKRILDARGKWHPLEDYIREHTEAEFSHSLCPECIHSLYPDLFEWQKELDFGPEQQ
jgi:PAS domain S-box-containing protein